MSDIYQRSFIADTTGNPLDSGKVYIGLEGEDPETDPITVYWDRELTIPASQPLQVSKGYIWNSGARADVYTDSEAYSLRIRDRLDQLVDYVASATSLFSPGGAGLIGTPDGPLLDAVYSRMMTVDTRLELKNLNIDRYKVAYLNENGRKGIFRLKEGSGLGDTLEGIYIPSTTFGYYWERDWDGIHGQPEWFGAKVSDITQATNNLAAIHACRDNCQITLLSIGTYYVSDTVKWTKSDRHLYGSGMNYGGAFATIINLTGANASTKTVFQFGADSYDVVVRGIIAQDIGFTRNSTAVASPTGDAEDCVKGVLYRYATNSELKRCRVFNSPVGFHVTLTATSLLADCNVEPANSVTADINVAYLFGGYSKYPGFVGSNGSLRAEGNTAFGAPAAGFNCHTLVYGFPADTWIDKMEGALGVNGLMITAMTKASMIAFIAGNPTPRDAYPDGGAAQDITVSNTRMDGYSGVGFFFHHIGISASINCYNPYSASSDTGFALNNVEGRINIDGGEILASAPSQGGIDANNVQCLRVVGLYIRDFEVPVQVANCVAPELRPTINNWSIFADTAINLINVDRAIVAPTVRGNSAKVSKGVALDSTSTFSGYDVSGVDPGCFVIVDKAYKLRYSGQDASSGGAGNAAFIAAGNVQFGVTG